MTGFLLQLNRQLCDAAQNGEVGMVQELIGVAAVNHDNGAPLQLAARYGREECVRVLMEVTDKRCLRWGLAQAVANKEWRCADILFARVRALDFQVEDTATFALQQAFVHPEVGQAEMFLPFINTDVALRAAQPTLRSPFSQKFHTAVWCERICTEQQRRVLLKATAAMGGEHKRKI